MTDGNVAQSASYDSTVLTGFFAGCYPYITKVQTFFVI